MVLSASLVPLERVGLERLVLFEGEVRHAELPPQPGQHRRGVAGRHVQSGTDRPDGKIRVARWI